MTKAEAAAAESATVAAWRRKQRAEEVLFALNPTRVRDGCCVKCGRDTMNFAVAAISPNGERKGVCGNCSRQASISLLVGVRLYVSELMQIKAGKFD